MRSRPAKCRTILDRALADRAKAGAKITDKLDHQTRIYTIKGRVQGVWFRDSTRREALKLGITGYAKNLPNGDVEVLAVGEVSALDHLCQWLHEGSRMAKVSEVLEGTVESGNSFSPAGFAVA